jgi:D-serine dehydratase
LDLFSTYRGLLADRLKSIAQTQKRYEGGLKKIGAAQDLIQDCHAKLELRTPLLQKKQLALIEAAARIEMRFSEIQVLREQLKQEEYLIHEDLQRA